MKQVSYLVLSFMWLGFFLGAEQLLKIKVVDSIPVQKKISSTCLVYIAADNSLHDFAPYDLLEMVGIGSTEYLTILTYLNTKDSNGDKVTKRLFVQKDYCLQDGTIQWQDSGSAATLKDSLEWTAKKFPSDQLVVILWNHGSGELNRFTDLFKHSFWWLPEKDKNICHGALAQERLTNLFVPQERGVCYDDTTGSYLTDRMVHDVFSEFIKKYRNNKLIDIVGFDACLMADCEIAYSLLDVANYLVASQETIPGQGFGYADMFASPAKGSINAETYAKNLLAAYDKEYKTNNDDYTLSAINLQKFPLLFNELNSLSIDFITLLSGDDSDAIRQIIKTSRSQSSLFEEPSYIDLALFATKLVRQLNRATLIDKDAKAKLITILNKIIEAVNQVVIGKVGSVKFGKVGGLSIYFDAQEIDPSYNKILWSESSHWIQFLQQFLGY